MLKTSDQVKISIKKPDGTVIKIDLPQERDLTDILQVLKGVLGTSSRDNQLSNDKEPMGVSHGSHESFMIEGLDELSVMDKIKILIKNAIPLLWFSSHDLQELYQHYFGSVPLSTVSTYLARLVENNILERQGSRMKRKYKLAEDMLETTPALDLNKISVVTPTR